MSDNRTDLVEYNMIHELLEQVDWNCTLLEEIRDCASPEELRKIDSALRDNIRVIEKVKESLKTVYV